MEQKEFNYSKSKYVKFCECNKRLWLEKYKPDEEEEQHNETQCINGNMVGDLAMQLFGNYYLAETNPVNIPKQVENTRLALDRNERVICEASFTNGNNYCAVDILKLEDDGTYSINEVKSSTKVKDSYIKDLSYQYYVLTKCGINVSKTNIIYVNNKYVFNKELNLKEYFVTEDITELVVEEAKNVEENLDASNKILLDTKEPLIALSKKCEDYSGCPFKNYCYKAKGLPENNSVLELYNYRNKYELISKGILDFEQLVINNIPLNEIQKRQVEFALYKNDEDYYINKVMVEKFINKLKYPLYFFDFESYQAVIPNLNGTRPYQQITFQYSLHILYEDGKIEHKEFIGNGKTDPRLELTKQMIFDLGTDGTIIAYNDSFEKTRIKELKNSFKQYEEELNLIVERFVDLEDIFQKGYFYNKAMKGSFSIKSVLPSLFPNDETLNYKSLEQVHKGDEASQTYLELPNMNEEDYNKTIKNLLAYCKLDTYAMVKIYKKMLDYIK
ncbi:MAG: DUF2779 domain-containing protein [Anaeroplasmataceae bacterium]